MLATAPKLASALFFCCAASLTPARKLVDRQRAKAWGLVYKCRRVMSVDTIRVLNLVFGCSSVNKFCLSFRIQHTFSHCQQHC